MFKATGELRNDYQKIKEVVAHNPEITSKEFEARLQEAGITDINCVYANSNGRELAGYTLLHYSISFGDQTSAEYKKIIELLIANNEEINLQTTFSCMSPLDLATSIDDVEVMKMILNTKQSTEQNKINALCFATIHGNLEAIDLLINNGVNINSLGTNERMSPLSFAIACPDNDRFGVSKNRIQVIQHLLSKGADHLMKNGKNPYTDEQDGIGTSQYSEKSPLEIAREKGDQEIIKLLESPREIDNSIAILESKYKEIREDFFISFKKDCVGIAVTGLLITAAVLVPTIEWTIAFSILAALVAIGTLLHVKDYTLPSYREMRDNEIEPIGMQFQNRTTL